MKNVFLKFAMLFVASVATTSLIAQNNNQSALKPVPQASKKESPKVTAIERPIVSKQSPSAYKNVKTPRIASVSNYLNLDYKIKSRSITGQIPAGFPKYVAGQSKKDYLQIIRNWAKNNPNQIKSKTNSTQVQSPHNGIRGSDIIGEGKYLTFEKEISSRSINGQIPNGFPKHIKGQSKKDYVLVMKQWAKNNPNQIKPQSDYLEFDLTIKAMNIDGAIPQGFPKYIKGQPRKKYIEVMKQWAKQNISQIKPEYWSIINK